MLPERLQRPKSEPEEAGLLSPTGSLAGLRQTTAQHGAKKPPKGAFVFLVSRQRLEERVNLGKVLKYSLGEEEDVLGFQESKSS